MSQDKEPSTMRIWDQVCKTESENTKHVNQRGGFTAINAQSQIMKATELWGPYGQNWGVKDCRYRYVECHIPQKDGPGYRGIVEVTLDAVFFYPNGVKQPDVINSGFSEFEISADIKYRPGDDCRKKLLTDLTTKALSKLGFNADIFLGLWDDNKYTQGDSQPANKASDW